MSTENEPKVSRGRQRRWRRRVFIALAIPFVLAVTLWLFQGPILRRFAVPPIERVVRDALGLEFFVASMAIGLDGRVRVRSLSIDGGEPRTPIAHVAFESLEVDPRVVNGLFGDGGVVDALRLDGLDLKLDLDRPWPTSSPASPASPARSSRDWLDPLPRVQIVNADIEITRAGKTWRMAGVDVDVIDQGFTIVVRELDAPVVLPPAVAMPIEARGVLGSRESLFRQLDVALVKLAGVEYARVARWTRRGDTHRIEAELPAVSSSIDVELENGTLDARARVRELDLGPALAMWVPRAPAMQGHASGALRLRLPLDRPRDLSVGGQLEVSGYRLEAPGLGARTIRAEFEPRAGELAASVFAGGASLREVDAIDADGRIGFDLRDFVLRFRDLRVSRFDSSVELAGEYRLSSGELAASARLVVPDASAHFDALSSLPDIARDLVSPASVAGDIEFSGDPRSPESWRLVSDLVVRDGDVRSLVRLSTDELRELGLDGRMELALALSSESALDAICVDGVELRSGESLLACDMALENIGANIAARAIDVNAVLAGSVLRTERLADFELRGGDWAFGPARLVSSSGQLDIAGWRNDARHVLSISGASFDLGALPSALARALVRAPGVLDGLAGTLLADAELSFGPDGPRGAADLRLRELALGRGEARIEGVDLDASLEIAPDSITCREAIVSARGDALQCGGTLVLPAGDEQPWLENVVAHARVVEAARWLPPNDLLRGLSGSIELDATIDGALKRPTIRSRMVVDNGQLRFRNDIKPITDLDGVVVFDSNQLHVVELAGRYDGSPIDSITGVLKLDAPGSLADAKLESLDLELAARDFALLRQPDLRLRGDFDLRLRGPLAALELGGQVRVTRGRFTRHQRLFSGSNPLPFTLFSIKSEPLKSLRFDLGIRSDKALVLNNNLVRTDASLDLRLHGTAEEPVLTGTIWAERGRVQLPASTLMINGALVTFTEKNPYDPTLQIELSNRLRGYDVLVNVTGTISSPDVALESSPPMEREKVFVLVTTGYTVEDIRDQGAERAAAIRLASYLGSEIARYFRSPGDESDSFLNRFSFETEASRQSDLEELLRLEYRITEHLFLQGERDYYGDFNFNAGVRLEVK